MKRSLSSIAAAALVLGSLAPAAFAATTSSSYTDLAGYSWAAQDINSLSAQGYIHGYSNGTFQPGAYVTRGQFLAYFMNAMAAVTGVKPHNAGKVFKDVEPGNWAYEYVSAAYRAGWINPYWLNVKIGSNFNENYRASRGDAASFFVAAMEKTGIISSTNGMSPLAYAESIGLFDGIPNGQDTIYLNRAAAAVVLQNMLNFASNPTMTETPASETLSLSSNTLVADGTSTDTVTAKVVDANGNPVPGIVVNFTSSNTSSATVQPTATTDSNGVATATVTAGTTAGSTAIMATVGNVTKAVVLTVTPTVSTITNSLGNLSVQGQSVGSGSSAAPAVAAVDHGVTVSTTVTNAAGNLQFGLDLQYLVSTSSNITATADGTTLVASQLSAPVVIGNNTYNAVYSVPVNSQGVASATFTSSASSTQPFNVVVRAPLTVNGQPVQSNQATIQWGIPGTLVLTPLYSNTPDNLNFSTASNPTAGLVPVVATILPASGSQSVSGQTIQFTLSNFNQPNGTNGNVYFTDASGVTPVAGNSILSGSGTVTYDAVTNASGQAIAYINANQPETNNVAEPGAQVQASVSAEVVNGGSSTGTSTFVWGTTGYPSQVANISPSQSLNVITPSASTTNEETATSGSKVTFSGTVEDASGNPVANARLVITDWNAVNGTENNMDSDSYVPSGSATSQLFSGTSFDVVTTNAQGQFTFTTTATVPVTQSVENSSNTYYVYYAPDTLSVVEGQSLPQGLIPLTIDGSGNNALNVLWQQGQTVQAVGVNHNAMQTQYNALTDVPTTFNFSNISGSSEGLYAAAYNQNGQVIAPSSSNQFANYSLTYTITTPSGIAITQVGDANLSSINNALNSQFAEITGVTATLTNGGALMLNSVTGYTTSGALQTITNINNSSVLGNAGSGMIPFTVNSYGATATANGISGSVNVSVSATNTQTSTAEGGASGTITANFTPASAFASLGVASSLQQMQDYTPLVDTNAPLPSSIEVSGSAYGATGSPSNNNVGTFIVAPFNNFVNLATIPTQGFSYNISGTKSGDVYSVDGYVVPGNPQTATVNVQPDGVVSVNNTPLWADPNGGTVVGYGQSGTTTYVLVQGQAGTSTTPFTLYSVSSNGALAEVASYPVPNVNLPTLPATYFGFSTSGSTLSLEYNNSSFAGLTTVGASSTSSAPSLTLTPVQIATVQVSDEYVEQPTFTVSNTLTSSTATVTGNFSSAQTGLGSIVAGPSTISAPANSSQTVTFEAMDQFGNPVPNQSFYIQPNQPGLWITAVNGQQLTGTVNMGTATQPSNQTENTPVPLFGNALNLGYQSVSATGITAYHLNGTEPVVSLETGANGEVTVTLADGNVTYITAPNNSETAQFEVAPSVQINSTIDLTTEITQTSTDTVGTLPVTWNGQQPLSASATTITSTSTSTSDEYTTTLTVTDVYGNLVTGLSSSDITLTSINDGTNSSVTPTLVSSFPSTPSTGEYTVVSDGSGTYTITIYDNNSGAFTTGNPAVNISVVNGTASSPVDQNIAGGATATTTAN
ncbi:Ig-like domain-containing protein [Sulfoacidibacillus thermotolerans]|uniref:Attaching and effacing protein n=1 Tax=Sulfoacidibacillus thermotolerans TaxID=1765684 RepID=A0A2U3D649_SULT2|nr:S-layer homology domain-containing protein [Sulfoacidibacillus thermotolerans]PWI56756.1 hypothetical protein BM613_12070 [Sulfoacidibacillus thermotolerans]